MIYQSGLTSGSEVVAALCAGIIFSADAGFRATSGFHHGQRPLAEFSNSKGGPRTVRGPIAAWVQNNPCPVLNAVAPCLH